MSPTRRLRGVAAFSAAALASAGLAGTATAADGCQDDSCAQPAIDLGDLLNAFGGEEIPDEALVKLEQVYAELGMEDPAEAFLKIAMPGAGDESLLDLASLYGALGDGDISSDEAMAKLTALYDEMGMGGFAGALLKIQDSEGDAAFPKVEDLLAGFADDAAFPKVEVGAGDAAFPKVEDQVASIEEALLKLGASGDVDPAMVASILAMLPEGE